MKDCHHVNKTNNSHLSPTSGDSQGSVPRNPTADFGEIGPKKGVYVRKYSLRRSVADRYPMKSACKLVKT